MINPKLNSKQKIVVIGAGLSGLYSAFLLQELGYDVVVLEARDRVGGRTFTENNVDLGGQWVSSLQPRILRLCEQFNLSLYRQFDEVIFFNILINSVKNYKISQILKIKEVYPIYFNHISNSFTN